MPAPTRRMFSPLLAALTLALSLVGGVGGCNQHYRVDPILSTERATQGPWERASRAVGPGTNVTVMNPYTYRPTRFGRVSYRAKVEDDPMVQALNKTDDRSLYEVAADPNELESVRKEARNDLQRAIMRFSDEATAVHLAGVRAVETNVNLFLGAASIGLTGAAAVATAEAAKALAAAATGTQGARALVNEQVYRNALSESIIRLILADRAATKLQIERKWDQPMLQYPVESAIADAMEYHHKASFYHGLALVRAAAESKAQEVEKQVKDASGN